MWLPFLPGKIESDFLQCQILSVLNVQLISKLIKKLIQLETSGLYSLQINFSQKTKQLKQRKKRIAAKISFFVFTECVFVSYDTGDYSFETEVGNDQTVCGIYLLTEANNVIQVTFTEFNVPCEDEGLVSVSEKTPLTSKTIRLCHGCKGGQIV